MINLTVTQGRKSRRVKKKHPILLYIIIPFLAFFFYLVVLKHIPLSVFPDLIVYTPPVAKYETFRVSFDKEVPDEISKIFKSSVEDIQLNDTKRFTFVDKGEYKVSYTESIEEAMYYKEYVPVGHIYWIKGDTTIDEINESKKVYISSDDSDKIFLKQILGDDIEIVEVEDLLDTLKKNESNIALIPMEDLQEGFKVLNLDGKYCLTDREGCLFVGYKLEDGKRNEFVSHIMSHNMGIKYGASESMDRESMAKINMSGVVAIARGLASKIDARKDYAYPARDLKGFLSDADLTHVSNEVSFVKGCTGYTGMRFCSKPEYIESLKVSGVDIIELTGNHNNDYGASNNASTIETYKSQEWDYFGGGLNSEDASKILYKEVKGNLIAFMGYNYYNTMYDQAPLAKATTAGANSYSVEKLTNDIKQAKEKGALVVVTFQFQECYCYPSSDVIYPICYKPLSSPDQKGVFRQAIDLGADIVIGTQAHQPQTYEVYKEGIIFYGLGNLYFDQDNWIGTRQGLILSLYISNNDLVQVKITPTIMDGDMIPRVAGVADSNLLLNLLKSARTF